MTYPGPPPVVALQPCDLKIDRGQYVSIVGPSGSGKSTFLNVAGLLDRPSAGQYRLDGIAVEELNEADRTALRGRRIGFVFQSFHLLQHRTALENVALAGLYLGRSRREREDRAISALHTVGLAHRLSASPTHLSGGERQRVAIARALVNRPSILLADEPTGNLDSKTAAQVLELIDELHASGMTVVMITHDAAVAMRGDRTITISDGVLAEREGAPHA